MRQRAVLIIAGSDCSGGAGLEADQRVSAVHGCYAMTACTALTVQNTTGVKDVHYVSPQMTAAMIDANISDIGCSAVKIGMLGTAETVKAVAEKLKKNKMKNVVLDPVMVSTSNHKLLADDAVELIVSQLLPLTTVLTPNIPEARLIMKAHTSGTGIQEEELTTAEDMIALARDIQNLGPKWVLLKGGHAPMDHDKLNYQIVCDVLLGKQDDQETVVVIRNRHVETSATHGTGCSLASAIACNLANGVAVENAVRQAVTYVAGSIEMSDARGQGNGPINHLHSTFTLPFAPGRFLDYLLNRTDVCGPWKAYTEHSFVTQMGKGTLPMAQFKYYLIQDYLYLIQFARANALAGYKARTLAQNEACAQIVQHIASETQLHLSYCETFGITRSQMEATEEHQACTAYTRYVLDIGQSEDFFALQMAIAPCLLGYEAIAKRLVEEETSVKSHTQNPYWRWILNYVADDYTAAVEKGSKLLEEYAALQSPSRIERLVEIFIHATNMEIGFWDMGAMVS